MIRKIGLVLAALVVAVLGYAALKQPHYLITREMTINAPVAKIFPYLNNSKLAGKWSPWQEIDPKAQMLYSGPDEGVGSRTSWVSDGQLGTGSATIVETVPLQAVVIKLAYEKPFKMEQMAKYAIRSSSDAQTVVAWSVEGDAGFLNRVMCTVFSLGRGMDAMVGDTFTKGLTNLKNLVEKS